jgi:AIPR protein
METTMSDYPALSSQLPPYLTTYEHFATHLAEQFGTASPQQRGDRFVNFALQFIPQIEESSGFFGLEISPKKSHDGGIDLLTARSESGARLFVQSKYRLRTKDDLDSVISKFEAWEAQLMEDEAKGQATLWEPEVEVPKNVFMLITSSPMKAIIDSYLRRHLSSRPFYDTLVSNRRLHIIDGHKIMRKLQGLYLKSFLLPPAVDVASPKGWLSDGHVYLGIMSGSELVQLHEQFGDGLFFENIRDFLGAARTKERDTVNLKILETIEGAPEQMLERNNGITMRARLVQPLDEYRLHIEGAAIVNGCQTTMCLVHSGQPVDRGLFVPIKIVETEDAWQIARAANYQNVVRQIDLDLARYLRPQLVQKAATDQGHGARALTSSNIGQLLTTLSETTINYEETKYLYLGLFSGKPSQLFDDNYTNLRTDVLETLYATETSESQIFGTLFALVRAAREAQETCLRIYSGKEYSALFKRVLDPDKPKYNSYLSVLALCGALKENLAERSLDRAAEAERMRVYLSKTDSLLAKHPKDFERAYLLAYQVLADLALEEVSDTVGDALVGQRMFKKISATAFQSAYVKLRMRLDSDAHLHER